jgi:ubiquinone/menaquinone biosynthesis C-methylase UbiE
MQRGSLMSTPGDKAYTFGYTSAATEMMAARSAKANAAFFLEHVRSGMRVLDCGCGPGSITLGLAELAAPGQVFGVDIEPSQAALARTEAARRGIENVQFETADVCHLPFPAATFDAVFGHTILMQFSNPLPILAEAWRVLKPGGVAGFREWASDGSLYEPPDGARRKCMTLLTRMMERDGRDPRVGRRLGGLLHGAGFRQVRTSASYEVAGTPEAKRIFYDRWARLCEEADWMGQAISLGWVSKEEREALIATLRAEGATPEAFAAAAFCEAIGWKHGESLP